MQWAILKTNGIPEVLFVEARLDQVLDIYIYIFLPCLAIYNYFSIYKLITEPLYLLLEDQRSEINCKGNIKATRPLMERLVYHGLLCMLFSSKFIPNQNLLYGKILPLKK